MRQVLNLKGLRMHSKVSAFGVGTHAKTVRFLSANQIKSSRSIEFMRADWAEKNRSKQTLKFYQLHIDSRWYLQKYCQTEINLRISSISPQHKSHPQIFSIKSRWLASYKWTKHQIISLAFRPDQNGCRWRECRL